METIPAFYDISRITPRAGDMQNLSTFDLESVCFYLDIVKLTITPYVDNGSNYAKLLLDLGGETHEHTIEWAESNGYKCIVWHNPVDTEDQEVVDDVRAIMNMLINRISALAGKVIYPELKGAPALRVGYYDMANDKYVPTVYVNESEVKE